MSLPKDRFVCFSELVGYFAKKDLLGGLTEAEKLQLRTNIGILNYTGEGGQSTPVELTYAALYDMITRKALIVGARYIITDFQTIYSSNVLNGSNKVTWGLLVNPSKTWKLLVIANTNSQLDSRVYILEDYAKEWIVEYDITQEVLDDGIATKGKITYLKDQNGNSTFYDFKNIKFRRTQSDLLSSNLSISGSYVDLFTFSDINNDVVTDNSDYETTKYNVIEQGCWDNIFLGDTYNNIIKNGCKTNTFIRGCHDSIIGWDSSNNLFNELVAYTSGSIYSKKLAIGNTTLSTAITKTIHKVNEATIVSFLDPITYTYQVIIL